MQSAMYKGTLAGLNVQIGAQNRQPTLTVKVDWGYTGTGAPDYSQAGDEISADVKSISTTKEMQEDNISILVKGAVSSDLDIVLKNADKYSKYESTGKRYNTEIVMLPIQIAAGYNDNEVQLFEGYIKSLTLDRSTKEAYLYCFDKSILLKNATTSTNLVTDIRSDLLMKIILRQGALNDPVFGLAGGTNYMPFDSTLNDILSGGIGQKNMLSSTYAWGNQSPPVYVAGQVDNALSLGAADFVRIATNESLKERGSFYGWVKTTWDYSDANYRVIWDNGRMFDEHSVILFKNNTGNKLILRTIGMASSVSVELNVDPEWTANEWHFIAAAWDEATNEMSLYFDGISATQTTAWVADGYDGTTEWFVGAQVAGNVVVSMDNLLPRYFFNGIIERFGWFGSALTAAQIASIRAASAPDIDRGNNIIPFAWLTNENIWDTLSAIAEAEQGRIYFDEVGQFHFKNCYSLITDAASVTSQKTIAGTGLAKDISLEETADNVFNSVSVEASPMVKDAGATVLWTYSLTGMVLNVNGVTIIADLEFPCDPADIVTPVATTDYTANSKADGTGVNCTSSMSLSLIKRGQQVTIVATGTSCPPWQSIPRLQFRKYITKLQLRGKAIREASKITGLKEDATSIAKYGRQALAITNDYIRSEAVAKNLAGYIVEQYKNPTVRITNLASKFVPQLQLADRITVADASYYHINADYWLKRIGLDLSDKMFEMTMDVVKAENKNWGFYGSGVYGTAVFIY